MDMDLSSTPKNVHFDNKGKEIENEALKNKEEVDSSVEDEIEEENEIEDIDYKNVKDRQEAINVSHPFGLRLWKPALYKKDRSIFATAQEALHSQPGQSYTKADIYLYPGNIIWAVTFGWVAALTYLLVAILLLGPVYLTFCVIENFFKPPQAISLSPNPKQSKLLLKYIKLMLNVAQYILWPFGKYIERVRGNIMDDIDYYTAINEEDNDRYKNFYNDENNEIVGDYSRKRNEHFAKKYGYENEEIKWNLKKVLELLFNNGVSGFFFYLFMFTIIAPMHLIVATICWLFVVSIPMFKLNFVLLNHVLNEPFELYIHSSNPPPFQFNTIFKKIHKNEGEAVLPLVNDQTTSSQQDISNDYQVSGHSEIILCTYRAIGLRYYKYTIGGINVIFFNSLLFVIFTLLDAYLISPSTNQTGIGHPLVIFFSSLFSVIPLAYFIGMSVSSITAQTNLALGAVINATFGSIIEIILYTIALNEGKAKIVEGSLIGSVLTGILALPGMSMLTGGIKRKEQKFNAKSAGVTSTLLIVSLIGVFTPTLFQKFYGTYNVECESCPDNFKSQIDNGLDDVNTLLSKCTNCHFKQPDPVEDPFYQSHTKKLVWICAVSLLLTYAVGLLFTLLTHVKQIYEKTKKNKKERRRSRSRTRHSHSKNDSLSENPSASTSSAKPDDDIIYNANGEVVNTILNVQTEEPEKSKIARRNSKDNASIVSYNSDSDSEEEEVGHEPPSWTKLESVIVLLVSTVVFSLLAEILIGTVDVVLKNFNLDEKFLGVTLFAMAPNVSEFYNAIAFAMYGNIALSLEIGSAYATQVTMLQIPTLVLICAARAIFFDFPNESKYLFTLIFSRWDLFTIIIGVFLLSHVYTEGKSNYFKGAMLLMSYTVFVISYYFIA